MAFFLLVATVLRWFSIKAIGFFPTPPWPDQVAAGSTGSDRAAHLSLFISNVLMDNREIDRYLEIVRRYDPDILIADETNGWWVGQLEVLRDRYPHAVTYPLANTYGMALYSKLPLLRPEVRFLVKKHVPSDSHPRGAALRGDGHVPQPPSGSTRPARSKDTEERDAELLLVARKAAASPLLVIVAGDLNDVAWSHTTRLFQKISGLLDPRVGRGMYNTYTPVPPAPLSPRPHLPFRPFRLIRLEKGPAFGSDHFQVFIELRFAPAKAPTGRPPPSSPASPGRRKRESARPE